MADFPGAIYEPRDVANLPGVTYDPAKPHDIYAEDFTNPADEIVAIETILGVNPQGAYATVKAWLEALAAGGGGGGSGEPLTNGDLDNPEILFAAGDILTA